MSKEIRLSIIIVSHNTMDHLRDCLDSIYGKIQDSEIVVVDNHSDDGTREMLLERYPNVRTILNDHNTGFGPANNQGMRIAHGRYMLLLNSDTVASPGEIEKCLDYINGNNDVGTLGCCLKNRDGVTELSCGRTFTLIHAFFGGVQFNKMMRKFGLRKGSIFEYVIAGDDLKETMDVDWVTGAFMLLRKEVFEQTKGFDEKMFLYGEDHEWCYRIKKSGWRIIYFPEAEIIHIRQASGTGMRKIERYVRIIAGKEYYFKKHFGYAHSAIYKNMILMMSLMKIPVWWLLSLFRDIYKENVLYNLAIVHWYFGTKVM